MGEKQNQPFQLSFNASLKVDSQGSSGQAPATAGTQLAAFWALFAALGTMGSGSQCGWAVLANSVVQSEAGCPRSFAEAQFRCGLKTAATATGC